MIAAATLVAPFATAPARGLAQCYPDPPPDIAHPSYSHAPLFSVRGGNLDRPLLVVYMHFSDAPEPAGRDLAWARQTFFGPGFPNVTEWYATNSFGRMILSPAAETEGDVNDGIVRVDGGTIASYTGPDEGKMNRTLLELADPFVDFSAFDTNGDGTVTNEELLVYNVRVHYDINNPGPGDDQQSGATRGLCSDAYPCPALVLDGKTISLPVAMGLHDESFMTWCHELAHISLDMLDLYGFGVGALDVGAASNGCPTLPTCVTSETSWQVCGWSKLHWGWIEPTVVTRDGFYDVPVAEASGKAFILYDPARGTDDYFVVENRRPLAGTYDQDVQDDGLVIWRCDDKKFTPPYGLGPDASPVAQRQPNSSQVAWDPSDPLTPERTMTSPWRDGTTNALTVRAIGPKGDVVHAYFDVCGPGVLVDTYPVDLLGAPKVVTGALQTIAIPVMNTGDATDTFEFQFTGLPAGWTPVPLSMSLAPGVETTIALQLTPAHDHPEEVVTVSVTGRSSTDPSVVTTESVRLEVVHVSDLAILGVEVLDASPEILADGSHSILVRARVTNQGPSSPTDATVDLLAQAGAGATVAPSIESVSVLALEKGEERLITKAFRISCHEPGIRSYTFSARISPTNSDETDIIDGNNEAQTTITTECVTPVAINIRPGSITDPLNLKSKGVPVAVLSTAAGEYGLAIAFDATQIDPLSVRFGQRAVVTQENGAVEMHGKGHPEDALELDEQTRDGDIDMLLHFLLAGAGAITDEGVGCVRGEYSGSGGTRFKFFGCGDVNGVPSAAATAVVRGGQSSRTATDSSSAEAWIDPGEVAAPNPFRNDVELSFALPEPGHVAVGVYDLSGRLVRRQYCGMFPAGYQRWRWDGRDETGRPVKPGVYLVRTKVGEKIRTIKLLRLE